MNGNLTNSELFQFGKRVAQVFSNSPKKERNYLFLSCTSLMGYFHIKTRLLDFYREEENVNVISMLCLPAYRCALTNKL